MSLKLNMVGIIVNDIYKSAEFYRRLGVAIPELGENQHNVTVKMDDFTFFINTKQLNKRWDPARSDAEGGYRIILEFFLETKEAVDKKYQEMLDYGYQSHAEPYVTFFNMYFAMIIDPDNNTILLSSEI